MNDMPENAHTDDVNACLWGVRQHVRDHRFTKADKRRLLLKLITEMRLDNHPSGYPDPAEISMLTHLIRAEKFIIVRNQGRGSSAAAEIQHLIDCLKRLEKAALQARPVSVSRQPWYREWSGLAGMVLMLISPVFLCFVVWLPPYRASVLALGVYALLTAAAELLGQDKYSPMFAANTWSVLNATAAGMTLHYAYTALSSL